MELYTSLRIAYDIINLADHSKKSKIGKLRILGFSWHEAAELVGYKTNSMALATGKTGRPKKQL